MKCSNLGFLFPLGLLAMWPGGAGAKEPNVLFIAVDDLRPELGCYGKTQIHSPNIDRIAADGTVFERSYCQQAVCGPSRLSVMTGSYPDTLGVYGMGKRVEWRDTRTKFTSLPEQFRRNGWHTASFGKVYDNRLGLDQSVSWDECIEGWKMHFAAPDKLAVENLWKGAWAQGKTPDMKMSATECADVPDETYTDGHVAQLAVDFLKRNDQKKPFFLAVGFSKPHLPFVAPKKYWDLYNRSEIILPDIQQRPSGCTDYTLSDYKEIFDYDVSAPVTESTARELVHGYRACISYMDAQVGKLLDVLKETGQLENTMIVLWGDHGFKLGEYGEWAKSTNLELDARAPLIIRLPGGVQRGAHSFSLVEFVDILPTLCDAAGIPVPDSAEGCSLMPVLNNPQNEVREFSLSQYPHRGTMGYSIRTKDWRYTEWRTFSGEVKARELYRLPEGAIEQKNVLTDYPEESAKHAALLQRRLQSEKKWEGSVIW